MESTEKDHGYHSREKDDYDGGIDETEPVDSRIKDMEIFIPSGGPRSRRILELLIQAWDSLGLGYPPFDAVGVDDLIVECIGDVYGSIALTIRCPLCIKRNLPTRRLNNKPHDAMLIPRHRLPSAHAPLPPLQTPRMCSAGFQSWGRGGVRETQR